MIINALPSGIGICGSADIPLPFFVHPIADRTVAGLQHITGLAGHYLAARILILNTPQKPI